MKIFGRTGCNEDKSWTVYIYLINQDEVIVTTQVSEKEAKKVIKEIINNMKKNEWIEIEREDVESNNESRMQFIQTKNVCRIVTTKG